MPHPCCLNCAAAEAEETELLDTARTNLAEDGGDFSDLDDATPRWTPLPAGD